jgi:hypothetical protein
MDNIWKLCGLDRTKGYFNSTGIHKNQTIILGRKRTFIQKEFKFEH